MSAIEDVLQAKDPRGEKAYDPRMMVAVLLYAYCVGLFSSRRIARATFEDVAVRFISGDQHPHFMRIAAFRRQHLDALGALFVQTVARLKEEIRALLAKAETVDAAEDEEFGADSDGLDIPDELERRDTRLARIRQRAPVPSRRPTTPRQRSRKSTRSSWRAHCRTMLQTRGTWRRQSGERTRIGGSLLQANRARARARARARGGPSATRYGLLAPHSTMASSLHASSSAVLVATRRPPAT